MAEIILIWQLKQLKYNNGDFDVQSCGLNWKNEQSMDEKLIVTLKAQGYSVDPKKHKSQPLTKDLVEWADLIYCMTHKLNTRLQSIMVMKPFSN